MKYSLRRENGNSDNSSIGVTIPKWIVNKLNLKDKARVSIDLQEEKIIITKEEN